MHRPPVLLQVSTPGLILPARSPALDNLRVLAAGCRACSTKGHVSEVLRARGTKDVDVRAAGFTIRFELEPHSVPTDVRPPPPSGRARDERVKGMRGEEDTLPVGGAEAETEETAADASAAAAGPADASKSDGVGSASPRTCLELAVGCCIYQKGRYLLGHAEGAESTTVPPRHPPGSPSRFPPSPPPPMTTTTTTRLPPVNEDNTSNGREMEAGENGGRRGDLATLPAAQTGNESSPAMQQSLAAETTTSPPRRPTSATKPVGGTRLQTVQGVGATHWGGGPGPRPCDEALTIVQSLRVPLSDPHYFRVAELSMYLTVTGANKQQSGADGGALVQHTQVLGGRENADDGWAGELLVTRCAVVGNPRQPGTRADAMLSRIRVEVRFAVLLYSLSSRVQLLGSRCYKRVENRGLRDQYGTADDLHM